MNSKNRLLEIILAIGIVLFLTAGWLGFGYLKNMENEFTETKASLIKENMDLKDQFIDLEEKVEQKQTAIKLLEKVKISIEAELEDLKESTKRLRKEQIDELESLKRENVTLTQKVAELEAMSIKDYIQKALEKEEDENVKKVLEEAVNNINLVESGEFIGLKPIVVSKREKEYKKARRVYSQPKIGEILSVNRKYNLIAINLGERDKLKEGGCCVILKDEKEIATAEIISVRYKLSAAIIDVIKDKYKLSDIKEGDKVLVE